MYISCKLEDLVDFTRAKECQGSNLNEGRVHAELVKDSGKRSISGIK